MSPTTTKAPSTYPEVTQGLVCLPPISDDLQLIWTQAELTHELDEHPQLLHTFSYFPYPSMPEIALLCLRYGLQMEKVKTWFMVQRIRCGVSWSAEEIEETRSRLIYNQDQLHFKPLVAVAKKSNVFKKFDKLPLHAPRSGEGQERLPHSPCPSPVYTEPDSKKMRLNCMVSNKKPETVTKVTNEQRMESPSWDTPGTYRHCSTASNVNTVPEHVFKYSANHPVSGQVLAAEGTEMASAVSCLSSEEEMHKRLWNTSWNMDDYKGFHADMYSKQCDGTPKREDFYTPGMRRQRKTKEQLIILKSFFLHCQWARREDYKHLEEVTGLPRSEIIQWFGDTRYALKHGQLKWFRDHAQERPSWLDDPQHHVNQNGKAGEPLTGEIAAVRTLTPELGTPELKSRTIVQSSVTSETQSLTPPMSQRIVVNLTAAFNTCSGNGMEKEPEIPNKYEITSGTPNHTISHSIAESQINCSKPDFLSQDPMQFTTPQKKYDVLEKYWCTHYELQETDLQSLVTESGLSQEQVVDWFNEKSDIPAEVEVCLDEEEEEEDDDEANEEEEDVVIIQD